MTIDAHVHLVGISPANGCFLSHRRTRRGFRRFQRGLLAAAGRDRSEFDRSARRRLQQWVEGSAVDHVGLLALDGTYGSDGRLDERGSALVVSNDYLFEVAQDSTKYLPVPSINPQRRDAIDELERVSQMGAVAIKTLPNTQNFDPALPRFVPFWQRMAELNLPLLAHTGAEYALPEHDRSLGDPERLRPALDEGLTVIAAHCATGGLRHPVRYFRRWFSLLEEYPRLFGDISAVANVSRSPYAPTVLRHPLARTRILLGSDYPIPVHPLAFAPKIGLKRALALQRVGNPIQRNLLTFRALGMDRSTEARAAEVFRMPSAPMRRQEMP